MKTTCGWSKPQNLFFSKIVLVPTFSIEPPKYRTHQRTSVEYRKTFNVLGRHGTVDRNEQGVVLRVSCSFATENSYTPDRLEALFKLSVVIILSYSQVTRTDLLQNFGGLWVFSSMKPFSNTSWLCSPSRSRPHRTFLRSDALQKSAGCGCSL